MGTFNTKRFLIGNPDLIPAIADNISSSFQAEGYEVSSFTLLSGGRDISITKGNVFKAVVGMKTALKVTLIPQSNGIDFSAGMGIFGQQAIPTIISMLYFWPVLITQIWGMVQQAKLDDKALQIAQETIQKSAHPAIPQTFGQGETKFCTKCGAKIPATAKFCPECGETV
jgi:hypothetical protein